jgi:benzoyl-CoA reductase subunit A
VVIDENQNILGRGITNSRSNYDTAAAVAKTEALSTAASTCSARRCGDTGALNGSLDGFIGQLERDFRAEQYLEQLVDLEATCRRNLAISATSAGRCREALDEVFKRLTAEAPNLFAPGAKRKSDFFRDIAGSQYLAVARRWPRSWARATTTC